MYWKYIHTRQLNFSFSDWLFSKYAECIENVHCTPRTANGLRPDCTRCFWCVIARANVTSTDPFFSLGKVFNILHVLWHFNAILFIILHEHEQIILFFCHVWIRLINLHLLLLVKKDKSNALAWIWCLSNALGPAGLGQWTHQNSVRLHWICLISLEKVNAHLLTFKCFLPETVKKKKNKTAKQSTKQKSCKCWYRRYL